MKILKFGGSSISSPEGLRTLAHVVRQVSEEETLVPVVISALEGETNRLLTLAYMAAAGDKAYTGLFDALHQHHLGLIDQSFEPASRGSISKDVTELLTELSGALSDASAAKDSSLAAVDLILSFGERLSALIVAAYLQQSVSTVKLFDARELIKTESSAKAGRVQIQKTEALIQSTFSNLSGIAIVTGFIASDENGKTTTLGRGGSDFTASLLASALDAKEIQIWTIVDGMMTADPKKVKRAFTVPNVTYNEALELGHFGAKVISAPAMQRAMDKKIPIRIKNSLNPEHPGSLVGNEPPSRDFLITGLSSISDISLFQLEGSGLIGISGTAKRLFDALSRAGINVILISQASSEHSICFAVRPDKAEQTAKAVSAEFASEIAENSVELIGSKVSHSIVAVVGENMRSRSGVASRFFSALGKNGVNVAAIAQGSSELNISAVIAKTDESKALNAIHAAFFLSDQKTIHLFIAGCGLVGKKLLEQIADHEDSLRIRNIELQIVGLATSHKMAFDENGIALQNWQNVLEFSASRGGIDSFVEQMKSLNLPNSIFVDCTASDEVAAVYPSVLAASISIVTPNKRANSGTLARYQELRELETKSNVRFFYETNVGAGLPIIGTLKDLISSGDDIIRIEAVLSGTLSYIFNSFGPGKSFSSIVREAKRLGYTEPDPRDDLSGKDVARKLLILAREIGLELEESDIKVESLVPPSCRGANSVDEFLSALEKEDGAAETLRLEAETTGSVLRYIGVVENGAAQVALKAVSAQHPFYSLSGSDNIVSFTTQRYFDRPLVVKGPGAGNDVTAAGVLADILRVTSYLV